MGLLRLSHIGLCVADAERSLRFYRDVLGFRLLSELRVAGEPSETLLQLEDVDLHAIYLERDGVRLELLHYASPGHSSGERPRPMNRLGLTHLSFRVEDLSLTVAALVAAGVEIVQTSHIEIPAFQAAAVFVLDPDGTRIELVQAPGDPNHVPGSAG